MIAPETRKAIIDLVRREVVLVPGHLMVAVAAAAGSAALVAAVVAVTMAAVAVVAASLILSGIVILASLIFFIGWLSVEVSGSPIMSVERKRIEHIRKVTIIGVQLGVF